MRFTLLFRFAKKNMASALLLTMLNVSIIGCPMSKYIAPCTCKIDIEHLNNVMCTGMNSYSQVFNTLHGHFGPQDKVALKVVGSTIDDMLPGAFKKLNMSIVTLFLNHDNLRDLNPEVFEGLNTVSYLSLSDNELEEVPSHLWQYMTNIKTLDLGRTKIKGLKNSHFKNLPNLKSLTVPGCMMTHLENNSIPLGLQHLHMGRNQLTSLNGNIRGLKELQWLFINANNLTDLEGELPLNAHKLNTIHASNNLIEKLPKDLMTLPALENAFFQHSRIKSLDGCFSKSRKMQRLYLDNNFINILTEDDFREAESLVHLSLGCNKIKQLNNSLIGLRNLQYLNITENELEEFSFEEIIGLEKLSGIDLSFNKISSIKGPTTNLVEWNIKVSDLKLDHNNIESLNGSLSGLRELMRLNLSFNKLKKISPDDLIGLDQIAHLDVSHNYLKTLEEMSGTFLPKLEVLKASNNYLTILERDFHGLPVLCDADLSDNQIIALGRDLVSKTRCTIRNGANEGAWDTLKINLKNNPILCDSALPEISSAMEINHTRIYGSSHCPPLSEQPVTSKPNGFLGYVPETTVQSQVAPPMIDKTKVLPSFLENKTDSIDASNTLSVSVDPTQLRHYNKNKNNENIPQPMDPEAVFVPQSSNDSLKLSNLASEIAALKSRVEELEGKANLDIKSENPNNEDLGLNRKP